MGETLKKADIFIASSIVDFKLERKTIKNLIYSTARILRNAYGVDLEAFICESADHAMSRDGRTQELYNQKIRESEAALFLLGDRVGSATVEEFRVARECFEKTGRPRIYAFFRKPAPGTAADESLLNFIPELTEVVPRYHTDFESADTVALRILLDVITQEFGFIVPTAVNGECRVADKKIMSLYVLPEFKNNARLIELERQGLTEQKTDLEEKIFALTLEMSRADSGGDISPEKRREYALLESGVNQGN